MNPISFVSCGKLPLRHDGVAAPESTMADRLIKRVQREDEGGHDGVNLSVHLDSKFAKLKLAALYATEPGKTRFLPPSPCISRYRYSLRGGLGAHRNPRPGFQKQIKELIGQLE